MHTLSEWANFYLDQNFTIIPLRPGAKEPRVNAWTSKGVGDLMNELREGDNIGIRLCQPYFVVDVDDRRLAALIVDDFPTTLTVETRRGFHFYFKTEAAYPKTAKKSRLIQILAEGCYVVAPPSRVEGHEYKFLDPKASITPLDGRQVEKLERIIAALANYEELIKAFAEVWSEGHRHNLSLWFNGALRKAGIPKFEAAVILKSVCLLAGDNELNDRLRALSDTYNKEVGEIAAWSTLKDELSAVAGPHKAKEILALLPSRKEREGPCEQKAVLSLKLPDGVVLEAVGVMNGLNEYDPKLLVLGPSGFTLSDTFEVDGVELKARHPKTYPYEPYVIEDFNVKTRVELVELVWAEVEKFIDAEPHEKGLFTAFIILSYLQEFFEALPYLYLLGDCASGKSHLLQLFQHLCYRPLYGVSIPAADIYTYLEDDVPLTLLEDEFQGSERDTEKMKIFKAGYKKCGKVPRVTLLERGRRIDYYNVFGLKAVASEELVANKGFLERCLIVEMVEGFPAKDHYDSSDRLRFRWLRGELLKMRMNILAGREALPSLTLEWLKGRDRELYLPLLTVLAGTALYDLVENDIKTRIEARMRERTSSLEAVICRAAVEVIDRETLEVKFSSLWGKLLNDLGGEEDRPPHTTLAAPSRGMHTTTFGYISKRRVSDILRGKLAFERVKTMRDGRHEIIFKPHLPKLARAAKKYGVSLPLPLITQSPNPLNPQTLESVGL